MSQVGEEVYKDRAMLPLKCLPESFLESCTQCAAYFAGVQQQVTTSPFASNPCALCSGYTFLQHGLSGQAVVLDSYNNAQPLLVLCSAAQANAVDTCRSHQWQSCRNHMSSCRLPSWHTLNTTARSGPTTIGSLATNQCLAPACPTALGV